MMSAMRRVLLVLALTVFVAGCGGKSTSAPRVSQSSSGAKPRPAQFLTVDSASHTVGLSLIAADGPTNNGFNFDGYGRGEMLVSVPRGWRVTVHCKNAGARRNSCVVISGPGASAPAFAGATTPDPVQGLANGQSATFSFVASRTGSYRIASMVPGHELARMYDVLQVTSGGRPAISARPGP